MGTLIESDRRLRVVTLIDKPDITGGGERMAVMLALRLDPSRFDRTLCSTRRAPGETFERELTEAGVRILTLDRESRLDLPAWRPLVSLLRRERVDILHAHKFGSNLWGSLLGRLARVPVVVAHEQSWASARFSFAGERFRAFLDRAVIARSVDAFIAVSEADRDRMVEVERIDPKRIRVLPNAVPTPQLSGHDVRRELEIPADAPVAVTVCQLRPEKALDLLVDTAALLRPQFPGLRVLVAGDGPEEAALRQRIREHRLEENVLLLGTRRDVPDVVAAADVAVCCSDFEGTPLSVMEYMGVGKPVVATRIGGLPEMIDHGVQGLLFEKRNAPELAAALARLFRDPAEREAMGEEARRRQRERFDLDAATRWLENLYEELYSASGRARANGRRAAEPASADEPS
jgi:glycosyltransferase involved in cell wall biosynthesis